MQFMVESLPGVHPPNRRSNPDSYADTPFVEEIASVEMPRKFSFPNVKMYDGTGDRDDHIAQYKQRILVVALPKESREATICKGFGSTLIGPALQWYINLATRSISSFAGLSDKFVEQFASSRSLEMTSDALYESSSIEWNTPVKLHSPLQPGESGGPRIQHPSRDLCLQERSAFRWGAIQRVDHVPLQDHGRCVVASLGAGEVGGRCW